MQHVITRDTAHQPHLDHTAHDHSARATSARDHTVRNDTTRTCTVFILRPVRRAKGGVEKHRVGGCGVVAHAVLSVPIRSGPLRAHGSNPPSAVQLWSATRRLSSRGLDSRRLVGSSAHRLVGSACLFVAALCTNEKRVRLWVVHRAEHRCRIDRAVGWAGRDAG